MLERHALALRTSLVIAGAHDAPYEAALTSAADSVTFDLASPAAHGHRSASRKTAARHAPALAAAGRAVHARVSDVRCGQLEADIAAVVGEHLSAVQLSGAQSAQDVRDVDVAIRRQEMRLGIAPGSVRLIPWLASAAGLLALPAMLAAIDRHGAVLLDVDGLTDDLGLSDSEGAEAADAVLEHAMWDIAVGGRARRSCRGWWARSRSGPRSAPRRSGRAREFGAAGACVASEAEVRGLNALFTPSPENVAAARRTVEEWERPRGRGQRPRADRRQLRRARALLAQSDALERRERAR